MRKNVRGYSFIVKLTRPIELNSPTRNNSFLADYMSRESKAADKKRDNRHDYCGKTFSNIEQLTAHYRKDHPESI